MIQKMATFNPTILSGDDEWDLEAKIVEICGLEYSSFLKNKYILTQEIFEDHFTEIWNYVKKDVYFKSVSRMAFQILGYFILLTGSRFTYDCINEIPERLRKGTYKKYSHLQAEILECSRFKYEKSFWEKTPFFEERRFYLNEFREKLRNHKPGVRTLLSGIDYGKAEEL